MTARRVLIHFDEANELFYIDDINTITVVYLLNCAQHRFYGEYDILVDPSECLCEGPYALKALDDIRFREIADMVQGLLPPDSVNEGSEIVQKTIHLWLCNCNKIVFVRFSHLLILYNFFIGANNGFLYNNLSTTDEQHHSRDTVLANANVLSKDIRPQSIYPRKKIIFSFSG
jgi:hypothetical protein